MAEVGGEERRWAVRVESLAKTFGGKFRALSGVSLAVAPGEMVALIGASGSGKSTLLRHIAGLTASDRGGGRIDAFGQTMQANGVLARGIRGRRARIGFVFQQFNLVNRLSVIKNVMCGELYRMPLWRSALHLFARDQKERALAALASVGIAEHAFKRASALSGGQQQRAAIARAIVQRAEIILADEPIASLDPESARTIMELLRRENRERGTTVLVSLHQIDFAFRFCPRTVALKDGRVVYDGPTERLDSDRLRALYGAAADELIGVPASAPRPIPELAPVHPAFLATAG